MAYKIKKYKYKGYILKKEAGMLNLEKPEYYEGSYIGKKEPTKADKETVIADYYDLPNREIKLHPEEKKEIKKNFSDKEQRRIFGFNIKGFEEHSKDWKE